ncbi:MAG: GNAT family N-acetyltransferase [Acidobacteriaceae bacterium]|jgi:ribosomal protein S18 acetylase RimI-like enzyme
MRLIPAAEADYPAIVQLANLAYRGDGKGSAPSWNVESGVLAGQRLDVSLLREELAAKPRAHLLTFREAPGDELQGMVWLDPQLGRGPDQTWYLGLLAVRPELQMRGLGHRLLAAAEDYARERGARRIRMTVISLRTALIAWYERRGYRLTGETEPFPYGDERFGRPLRDDLYFVILEKEIEFPR